MDFGGPAIIEYEGHVYQVGISYNNLSLMKIKNER